MPICERILAGAYYVALFAGERAMIQNLNGELTVYPSGIQLKTTSCVSAAGPSGQREIVRD